MNPGSPMGNICRRDVEEISSATRQLTQIDRIVLQLGFKILELRQLNCISGETTDVLMKMLTMTSFIQDDKEYLDHLESVKDSLSSRFDELIAIYQEDRMLRDRPINGTSH